MKYGLISNHNRQADLSQLTPDSICYETIKVRSGNITALSVLFTDLVMETYYTDDRLESQNKDKTHTLAITLTGKVPILKITGNIFRIENRILAVYDKV